MQRQNYVVRYGELFFYRGKWRGAARRALWQAKRSNPSIAHLLKVEIERVQGRIVRTQTFKHTAREFLPMEAVPPGRHGLIKNRS